MIQELHGRPRPASETGAAAGRSTSEITVVVVSNGKRPALLAEALDSVAAQTHADRLRILMVLDGIGGAGSDAVHGALEACSLDADRISQLTVKNGAWRTLPEVARVARLRNLALEAVDTPRVCFLDDDNVWRPGHVESLARVLESDDVAAAHSWRSLVDTVGEPWVPDRFPWLAPGKEARRLLKAYLGSGVFETGSSVVKDRVSLKIGDEELGMVDLGEWLFETSLLRLLGFEVDYTATELLERVGEDDKLLATMRDLEIPCGCTSEPTLVYRLGGFSNRNSS